MPPEAQTILVCDPDPAERGLLQRALQRGGRRVRIAATGADAMRVLATDAPDAVVLADRRADSECPALASWMRTTTAPSALPIIALVPHHDQDLMARCYEAGCDLVVSTPLDIDAFCLALEAVMRRMRPSSSASVEAVPATTRDALAAGE